MASARVWYVWPERTRMDSSKQAQGERFRGLVLGGRTAEAMPISS